MTKTIKTGALLAAGVLALSACGGSGKAADSASADSSSPTPTATLAVGQVQYTAAELEAALSAFKADRGLTNEIVTDAALRPQLAEGDDFPDGVTFTPEQCEALIGYASFIGPVDTAIVASVTINDGEKVTVVSHSAAANLNKQVEGNDALIDECGDIEVAGEGMGAGAIATDRLDASTQAPTTQAYEMVVGADGAEDVRAIRVAAASGTTTIISNMTAVDDPDETLAKAEDTINAVLAELEK